MPDDPGDKENLFDDPSAISLRADLMVEVYSHPVNAGPLRELDGIA